MINSDEILIKGIKQGDYACFNHLFFSYYGRLCAYVLEITKDHEASEDIIQELFIKLWTNREKIEVRESIISYLFRSSKNAALNYLRNEATRKNATEKIPTETFQSIEDIVEHEGFLSALDKCIELLPPRSKEVFLLSRFDGLKQKEISEKLNISVKTIKNQIWKSLQYLKYCIQLKNDF